MNASVRTLLAFLALAGWAAADLPRKVPKSKYSGLWTNSPFTTKPVVEGGPPPPNPLDDYALAGVSPISGGYRVTVLNKKKPEERIFIYSDDPNPKHGFKILAVTRKDGDPLGTVVRLSSGSQTGTVSYDDKLLTLAQAPAPKPNQPGQPQAQPGQPQPAQLQPGQMRQPRPRVVPPPVPGQTTPQPQVQPQIQPQVPVPQPQLQPQAQPLNNPNRADRRGPR